MRAVLGTLVSERAATWALEDTAARKSELTGDASLLEAWTLKPAPPRPPLPFGPDVDALLLRPGESFSPEIQQVLDVDLFHESFPVISTKERGLDASAPSATASLDTGAWTTSLRSGRGPKLPVC